MILPTVTHDVLHYIETSGPPVATKFCCLDRERLATTWAEFSAVECDGMICHSRNPWLSPLHMMSGVIFATLTS